MQQSHVGLSLPQQLPVLVCLADQQIDGGCAGFCGVGVEQFRQQLATGAGLDGEHKAGVCRGGPSGTPLSRGHCAEDLASFGQQHGSGLGERDLAAVAFQQCDSEPPLELCDRPGQRGLGYPKRWAALPKCNSSATATKYRSSRISISPG